MGFGRNLSVYICSVDSTSFQVKKKVKEKDWPNAVQFYMGGNFTTSPH